MSRDGSGTEGHESFDTIVIRLASARTPRELLEQTLQGIVRLVNPRVAVTALVTEGRTDSALIWSREDSEPIDDRVLRELIFHATTYSPGRAEWIQTTTPASVDIAASIMDSLGVNDALVGRDRISTVSNLVFLALDPAEVPDEQAVRGVQALSNLCALLISRATLSESQESALLDQRYRRLVEHSDAVIFHARPDHSVSFVSRRALDFFGIAPEDLVGEHAVRWFDFVHPEDAQQVRDHVASLVPGAAGFDEEFRVINRVTGRVRWLLVRVVPVRQAWGELEGWDGFGIDITARRDAQQALNSQTKKIRALFTVASAIRGYLDPASISSRGLAALCDATGANAGVCYLFTPESTDVVTPLAHFGFSQEFSQKSPVLSNISGLAQYVARSGQSLVVPDVTHDSRADIVLTEEENVRSAVLVPIAAEEEVLGAIGLFSSQPAHFDGGTVMLVGAAANQIGLAARQAHLFTLYKKQARNLSALYRVSHELARHVDMEALFQHAFEILRDELGLRRLWLGLLNDTGTRITGQAGYGSGFRKKFVGVNVEVKGRDHPIARVVVQRRAIVLENPSEVFRAFGIKRIFSRLKIDSVVLVPLVAAGQVLGVLAVQPGQSDARIGTEDLTLLSSLANEIAAHVLSIRLEQRIGESEKMRTAGFLAAGIAHNFNNVLQAILGQASLLEMQQTNPQRVARAAGIITEAATKGATLVRQLLSFAQLEDPRREACYVNDVIERSRDLFLRLIGSQNTLQLTLQPDISAAVVDPGQLTRIMSTLITNAGEAMTAGGVVEVITEMFVVDSDHPHFDVPFGTYVRVSVRDTGKGMDDETRRRCFEPFFTTKNVDRSTGLGLTGSGLGLAAAYALARRNDGRLVVESQIGLGSTFMLYLPVAQRDEARKDTRSSEAERARRLQDQVQVQVVRTKTPEPKSPGEEPVEKPNARKENRKIQ